MPKLIIFDVDGTLVEIWKRALLPGVAEWFKQIEPGQALAIATNQGGPALRTWMETQGWGEPEELPTIDEVFDRLLAIRASLGQNKNMPIFVSTAFKAKSGKWSPSGVDINNLDEMFICNAAHDWRKPAPGMLLEIARRFGLRPGSCLFVGNGSEDEAAALAAGMNFQTAVQFFNGES